MIPHTRPLRIVNVEDAPRRPSGPPRRPTAFVSTFPARASGELTTPSDSRFRELSDESTLNRNVVLGYD